MSLENSAHRSLRLKAVTDLLIEAEGGQLDGLRCPDCSKSTVSVWFSPMEKNEFRTWLICDNCGFNEKAVGAKPKHYSADRDIRNGQLVKIG